MAAKKRLPPKAYNTLKAFYNTGYKSRITGLENIGEYSFSILLYWNQIESGLKLIRYKSKMKEGYPDALHFINRNWGFIKQAFQENHNLSTLILGATNRDPNSLWRKRNGIAHLSIELSQGEYLKYKNASQWLIQKMKGNMSNNYDEERVLLLAKLNRLRT